MADDVEELGALLRCYRLRAGLTQEELAERAGLSARGISDLERGLRLAPHRDTVRMLADALALPPDDQARLARNIDRHRRPAAAITTSFMPTLAALPIRRTSFIGREHERVRLRDLLTRPSVRLVTLTGLGGVGKTRLALEVASDLQESGTPSIGFISLATIHDPGQLATTILQALRGREDPRQTAEETLKQMLSGEARLLLLDNFEQIVEAAPLLSDLLAACSELKLLVTSRVPLRLAGEHIFPLAPLASAAAVELFAARAHAIQHDAPSVSWDVSMLEAICSRLDNLPLALELAAPHVAVLPPPALLQRLQQRLPLLTHGPRDAPERQQDLRATIAWSYDLLPADVQALFRAVSVFAGGFTLDAAEAVARSPGAADASMLAHIRSLVEHNLIQPAPEPDGTPRFLVLELVREYAREQLEAAAEAAAIQLAHAEYFARWASRQKTELYGHDRRAALRRFDREQANLRAALAWCRAQDQPVIGLRLAAGASEYWRERGLVKEGYSWLRAFFPVVREAPEDIYTEAMFRLATFAYWLDDQQRARELSEGLLANSRRTGNDEGIGKALYLLASQPPWREPSAAISLLEEATHCFQRAGNPHWAVLCQGSLAKRAMELGQLERATRLLEQAYATCRRLEHDWGAALALEWLGRVAVATGDNARAIMHLRESLRLFAEEQDTMQFALTLIDITIPLARSGDTRQAVYLLASSEARLLEMGVTLMSWQQAIHQEVTTQARAVLGEPAMQEIWEAGRQMSLADIAAQLGTDDPLTLVPKDPS